MVGVEAEVVEAAEEAAVAVVVNRRELAPGSRGAYLSAPRPVARQPGAASESRCRRASPPTRHDLSVSPLTAGVRARKLSAGGAATVQPTPRAPVPPRRPAPSAGARMPRARGNPRWPRPRRARAREGGLRPARRDYRGRRGRSLTQLARAGPRARDSYPRPSRGRGRRRRASTGLRRCPRVDSSRRRRWRWS